MSSIQKFRSRSRSARFENPLSEPLQATRIHSNVHALNRLSADRRDTL